MTQAVLGVLCALRSEARQLGPLAKRAVALDGLPDGTLVCTAGVGLEAATRGSRRLLEAGAAALVSWGMAGALDPALKAGSILLPAEVCREDGTRLLTDSPWRTQVAAGLTSAGLPFVQGRLLTVTAAVVSAARKRALHASSGASAVDMESAAVAASAQISAVPFIALRVIVDSATAELPAAVQAATLSGAQVSITRLLVHLSRHPGELRAFLLLAGAYGRANRSLAHIARSGALKGGWPGSRNAA